jgi:hypothetical protein
MSPFIKVAWFLVFIKEMSTIDFRKRPAGTAAPSAASVMVAVPRPRFAQARE